MAIRVFDTFKPQGDYPVANAENVKLKNGNSVEKEVEEIRKDIEDVGIPELPGVPVLEPDKFYTFGEVSELSVTLAEVDDGKVHEYCFEFIPTEDFAKLNILPEIRWAGAPQFTAGKICQVSIVRNVGVLIRA